MRGTQEAWLVGHSTTWACLSHKAGRWCWWFVISDLKRVVSSTHACGIVTRPPAQPGSVNSLTNDIAKESSCWDLVTTQHRLWPAAFDGTNLITVITFRVTER